MMSRFQDEREDAMPELLRFSAYFSWRFSVLTSHDRAISSGVRAPLDLRLFRQRAASFLAFPDEYFGLPTTV